MGSPPECMHYIVIIFLIFVSYLYYEKKWEIVGIFPNNNFKKNINMNGHYTDQNWNVVTIHSMSDMILKTMCNSSSPIDVSPESQNKTEIMENY